MTRAEHDFYDKLGQAVGHEYRIFAQVHLPTLVDHKVKGQKWRPAFAHINGKSVDFVLCDKEYLSPKRAIELDDKTHKRADRIARDDFLERALSAAKVPLVRVIAAPNYDARALSAIPILAWVFLGGGWILWRLPRRAGEGDGARDP